MGAAAASVHSVRYRAWAQSWSSAALPWPRTDKEKELEAGFASQGAGSSPQTEVGPEHSHLAPFSRVFPIWKEDWRWIFMITLYLHCCCC